MATIEEVQKLAALARISIASEELRTFTKEFDTILAYVGQLETLDLPKEFPSEKSLVRNSMRVDGQPHTPGLHTKNLVAQFPARAGDALVVKQILSHE